MGMLQKLGDRGRAKPDRSGVTLMEVLDSDFRVRPA